VTGLPAIKTNNMNKEFIPYEQALELKELGFDEECLGYYHTTLSSSDVDLIIGKTPNRFYHLIRIPEHFDTLAPLYQQAFRWFREKHQCESSIIAMFLPYEHYKEYQFIITYTESEIVETNFNSYEEAELTCLKKLIEVVKQK
jgi:hypothetical protein